METRELFWEIGPTAYVVFYVVAYSAIAFFLGSVLRHILKYRRGGPHPLPVNVWAGIGRMIREVLAQRPAFRRDRFAGHGHTQIFYGFVLLFIGTSIITLEYGITEPLLGFTFWQGSFYLVFSLVMDVAGVALIAGLIFMIWRRTSFRLAKLEYVRAYRGEAELRQPARGWRREDWLFVGVLLVIAVTGFLQEAVRLLIDQPAWQAWSPVGLALAKVLAGLGMDAEGAAAVRRANWWLHGVLSLAFIAAIPWSKAKHMIAALGSLATRDPEVLSRLPKAPVEAEQVGVASIEQFSWKDALNFDACIRCGKCHEACPATAVGAPLSPRDLILDLRKHNDATQGRAPDGVNLLGDVIDPETIWACRSCGACSEICPVGIEHPPIIIQMRRHLVETGDMDPQLRGTLDMISNSGNSFGETPRKRGAWTRDLEFRVKDIRKEPADVLWFVGDYASFDPRNQKVTQTVARILRATGVDFGILYEGERTAGNDVRRVGEEGLFESLVEHNLGQMNGATFSSIITTDPHSYNTIRNEYPEFGDVAPIRHYTAVLAEFLAEGRLNVVKPLGKRATLHDPCHLGRLNGNYDEPRAVLKAIGCELVDMPRCRDNSFCCGAGGGRIWMPDPPGLEKPSENRIHEAAALGNLDVFVTCCPKDLTMFEDARKTSGHEKDFVVMDLAELVAEAIDLKSIPVTEAPAVVERITDAVAARVAEAVAARLADTLADRVATAVAERLGSGADIRRPAAEDTHTAATPPVEAREAEKAVPAGKEVEGSGVAVPPAPLPSYAIPAKERPRILVAVKQVAQVGDEF
ncbi:MAG: heterodisulfide reductase-related iron-sulfur binding cluster, partial [Alphaproteobacteria bacterium]